MSGRGGRKPVGRGGKKPAVGKKGKKASGPAADEAWVMSLGDIQDAVRDTDPTQMDEWFAKFARVLQQTTKDEVKERALEGLIEVVEAREPDDPEALLDGVETSIPHWLETITAITNQPTVTGFQIQQLQMMFKLFDSVDAADGLMPDDAVVPLVTVLVRNVIVNLRLPMQVRASGTQLLVTVIESSGSEVAKNAEILNELLALINTLCIDPTVPVEKKAAEAKKGEKESDGEGDAEGDDEEDDDEIDGLTPSRLGLGLLDAVKEHISPPSLVLRPLAAGAIKCLNSDVAVTRERGFAILAMLADLINPKDTDVSANGLDFKTALDFCLKGVQDPSFKMQSCAWEALQELCGKSKLPVVDSHAVIMAAVTRTLETKTEDADFPVAQAKCLLAATELIDTACESRPSRKADVAAYLNPLMNVALPLITAAPSTTNREVIESAFFLVRTVTDAMGEKKRSSDEDVDSDDDVPADADAAAGVVAKPAKKGKAAAKKAPKKAAKGKEDDVEEKDEKEVAAAVAAAATAAAAVAAESKGDEKKGAAAAPGAAFLPYYAPVMQHIMRYLSSSDRSPRALKTRAAATSVMSGVVSVVGAKQFTPYLALATDALFAGMKLGSKTLRNASFSVLGDLCEVFRYEMQPYMQRIVDLLEESLSPMYCVRKVGHGHGHGGHEHGPDCDHDDDDDEHDHDGEGDGEGDDVQMTIDNEAVEEQIMAIRTLQQMLRFVGPALRPHVGVLTTNLFESLDAPFLGPQTSSAALSAFQQITRALPRRKYAPGASVPLDGTSKKIMAKALPTLMQYFEHSDPEVVAETIGAVARFLKYAGPVSITPLLPKLIKFISQALNRAIPCASTDDDEAEEIEDIDDEEGSDDDVPKKGSKKAPKKGSKAAAAAAAEAEAKKKEAEEKKAAAAAAAAAESKDSDDDNGYGSVLDETCDLVTALARAMGSKFGPSFAKLLPSLVLLTGARESQDTRMTAIGAIGESCEGLEGGCVPFLSQLFPLALEGTKEYKTNVGYARNASFTLGVLALKGGEAAAAWYEKAAAALQPIVALDLASAEAVAINAKAAADLGDVNPMAGLRDNATSALGKMILMAPAHLKLPEVVPLFLASLPLTEDYQEVQFVYSCVIKMVNQFPKAHPGVIEPHYARIVALFEQVIGDAQVKPKVKAFVQGALTALRARLAASGDAAAAPLPEPELPASALPASAASAAAAAPALNFALTGSTSAASGAPAFSFPSTTGFSFASAPSFSFAAPAAGASGAAASAGFSFPSSFTFAPGANSTSAAASSDAAPVAPAAAPAKGAAAAVAPKAGSPKKSSK